MTSLNVVFFFLMFFFLCNHSEQSLLIAWGERESDIWLPLPLRVTRASRSPRKHKRIPFLATHSLMVALYAKKMREWTTSDVKKIKKLIKTFRLETFFSYLQLLNKKEL